MKTNGKFLVITGRPGVYEAKGQSKSGLLARHIETGKTVLASPFTVSFLDDIVVYTEDDKVSLPQVLLNIRKAGAGEIPSSKASSEELKSFFAGIVPGYDADRFYPSHMKKILQWYGILERTGRLDEIQGGEEEK